jgi:heme/copper-type cytochrome/quinol oxidase subunit 3
MFVYMQYNEYYYAPFTFADSVLGGVFYLTTGGHFLHI